MVKIYFNFGDKMQIETKRLIIRKFIASDINDFEELITNKMNSKYAIYDAQFPTAKENITKVFTFFKESFEFYAVEYKENHKLIGFLSLNNIDNDSKCKNLGYCLHSDYHIIMYAIEVLKLERFVFRLAKENISSVRLLSRMGFKIIKKELASFTKIQLLLLAVCLKRFYKMEVFNET